MAELTEDRLSLIGLDESGVVRVGKGGVALDEIIASHVKGHSAEAVLARFPTLTRHELQAAIDYHAAVGEDGVAGVPQHRDAQWKRWNATAKEDNGTDTPPNRPIQANV